MRKSFLLLMFLFVDAPYLNAQTQENNDQAKVQESITKFFDGFSALDITLVKQYSSKDFILLEDGVVWNMDSSAVNFDQLKIQLGGANLTRVNYFDFIKTEVNEDSAWVAYNNTADLTFNNTQNKKLQWLESAFFVKEGNYWKIKLLHSTMLKPDSH